MIEAMSISTMGPTGIGPSGTDPGLTRMGISCVFEPSLGKAAFTEISAKQGKEAAVKAMSLEGASLLGERSLEIWMTPLKVAQTAYLDKSTNKMVMKKTLIAPDFGDDTIQKVTDAGENETGTLSEWIRTDERVRDFATLATSHDGPVSLFWVSPGEERGRNPLPHRAISLIKDEDGEVKEYFYVLPGSRETLSQMMDKLGWEGTEQPLEEKVISRIGGKGRLTHPEIINALSSSLTAEEKTTLSPVLTKLHQEAVLPDDLRESRQREYQKRFEDKFRKAKDDIGEVLTSIAYGFVAVPRITDCLSQVKMEPHGQARDTKKTLRWERPDSTSRRDEHPVPDNQFTHQVRLDGALDTGIEIQKPQEKHARKNHLKLGTDSKMKPLEQNLRSHDDVLFERSIPFQIPNSSTDKTHGFLIPEAERRKLTERMRSQQEKSNVAANVPAKWQLAEQKVKTVEEAQVLSYHPQKTSEASIKYDSEQVAFALFTLALAASVCDIQDKDTISSLNPPTEEKHDDDHQNISMETTQKEQPYQKVARKKVIQALESQKQTPRKKRKEDSLDRVLLRNLSGIELPKAQPLLKETLALKGEEGLSGSNISESAQILTAELANILTQTEKLDFKTHHQTMEEKSKEMELKNLENEVVSLGKNTLLLLERKSGSREENKKPKLDHSTKEELAERLAILLTAYENKQTPNNLRSYLSALIFQQLKAFRIAGEEPFLLNLTSRLNELSPRISLLEEKLQELEERIKTMSFHPKIKPPRPIIPKENPAYNILLAFVNAKKWTRVPKQIELMEGNQLPNILDTKEKKRSSSYEQIFKKTDQLLFRRKKGKETVVKQRRQIRLLRQRVLNFLLLNEKLYSALRIDPEEMKKRQKRQPIRKVKTRARLDPKDILFEIGPWRKARFRRPSRKNRAKKTLHNVIFSAKRKFFPKSGIIYEYQTLCSIIN